MKGRLIILIETVVFSLAMLVLAILIMALVVTSPLWLIIWLLSGFNAYKWWLKISGKL